MPESGGGAMMKGVCFEEPLKVRVRELPRPQVQDARDVVVKVSVAALCGSDLHPFRGAEQGLAPGTVMGHEFCGVVVAKGLQVTAFELGDLVVSPFTTCCGACFACLNGLSCRCEQGQLFGWVDAATGCGLQGAQAEYVRVPLADATLVRLPSGVNPEHGLLLGDILSTAFYCATQTDLFDLAALAAKPLPLPHVESEPELDAPEPEADVAVVVGCGPVGLLAVASLTYLARAAGRSLRVIAVDTVPERLAAARALGAQDALDFKTDDVAAEVRRRSAAGQGAAAVLEVVGQPSAMRLAYACLRPGGTISSVGVHAYEVNQISPEMAYDKNITFRAGRCPVRSLLQKHEAHLLGVLESLKGSSPLFTHRVRIDDVPKAYETFNVQGDGMIKCLIDMRSASL